METTVKYGHLTTISGLSLKDTKFTGCLSGLGFTDSNVYVQTLPASLFDDSSESSGHLIVKNYSNLVFQIWPKLNFEANKEYQKLLKSQKALKMIGSEDPSDQNEMNDLQILTNRIGDMKKRRNDEIESNQALLQSFMNSEVTYGSEIQLYHLDSCSFLNGKILCSDTDKSAYKFELSNDYGTGMIFKIFPRYKLRTEGEIVQYQDQVVLHNIKLRSFLNFSCESPIEIDRPLPHSSGSLPSLTPPFSLKTVDPSNSRYEAYLSTTKNQCYWQFLYHGSPEPSNSTKLKGGDLIRILHTEFNGELSAETSFTNDFEECFLRKYQGEYPEERSSVNSIWEVEIDRPSFRGEEIKIASDENTTRYRLRHLISGKLLTVCEGFLPGDKKNKVMLPGLMSENEKNSKKGVVEFGETTADNPGFCEDNGYYLLSLNELFFFVEGKVVYQREGNKLGQTMTKMKNNNNKKMTSTMTGFSFATSEENMFTPLNEKEMAISRYAVLCRKEKSNENAFQLVKVDEDEKRDVLFVSSVYGILLKFINLIKSKEHASRELLKKVSKSLNLLIAFVLQKRQESFIAIEDLDEGIPSVSRQKILKDMRLIELLTDILYWPFRSGLFDIKFLQEIDPEIVRIFQLSYRLIKHGIKEFRPNEIYASQWIDLFLKQTLMTNNENDIYADVTLVELIDNNRAILKDKIKEQTIEDFVSILNDELHEKYVKLISALTICDGEAMLKNQELISRLILQNDEVMKRLVFPIEMREGCKLFIQAYENESTPLEFFKAESKKRDGERLYRYFIEFTNLLANLCRSRNNIAIKPLENVYAFKICHQIVSNTSYDFDLRTCFSRLTLTLFVDVSPFIRLVLPNKIYIWDELKANKNHLLCFKHDIGDFENLKGFISSHLSQIKTEGFMKAFEVQANEFTQSVLLLCKTMLELGMYKTTVELDDLLEPLFSLLNGTKDVTTPEELEERKSKYKDSSSLGLIKRENKKEKKRKRRKHKHASDFERNRANRFLRYEETETNQILHGCKHICCEILLFVMRLRNDMRVSLFLCEFKRIFENPNEVNQFKGFSGSMRLSSPSKKKQLHMSKNISRQNNNLDEEEEAQSGNLLALIDQICQSKNIDFSKSLFDPIAIYLDLIQYKGEILINLSYELLINSFCQRKNLVNVLKKLQILEDSNSIAALRNIQQLKAPFSALIEDSEHWFGLEDDADDPEQIKKFLEILDRLSVLLKTSKEVGNREILDEPDGEMVPLNERVTPKENEKTAIEDCLFDRNEKPFALNQNIMRNEDVYFKIIEILQYDIEKFSKEREDKIAAGESLNVPPLQLLALKKCYHTLARFASENPENQNVLQEFLKPIFLRHIRTIPEINGALLIEALFKNNKGLIVNTALIRETVHTIVGVVNKLELETPLKAHYLECLKVMTKFRERIEKPNQTLIITELCSKEFSNVFLTFSQSKELNNMDSIIKRFMEALEKGRSTIELEAPIMYLSSLLKVLAITCQEQNNATESKCQTFMPLSQITSLLNVSQNCWFLRKFILYFYFHVYLETEREINEDKSQIENLNNLIMNDLETIVDNMASNNGPSIKTNKGTLPLKQLKLKFFMTLLPCLTQILTKNLIKDETKKLMFINKLLDNLVKMSHWLDELSNRNKLKFSNFVSFLCEHRYASEDFRQKIDKESMAVKPGFKKTVVAFNLTVVPSLPHQSSSSKENPIVKPLHDGIKESKLISHIEWIEKNHKFIETVENEFETLVDYIVNVEDKTAEVFENECTFELKEITEPLIALISKSQSVSRELVKTGLTIFRKIIEKENFHKSTPAADWQTEDYQETKFNILKRQNQLVNLGVVDLLMAVISDSSTTREVREEAILVCISLLLGGNKAAQDAFVSGMEEERANTFCLSLKRTIQKSFESIKKNMNNINKKIFENLDKIERSKRIVDQENAKIQERAPESPFPLNFGEESPLRNNGQNLGYVAVLPAEKDKEAENPNNEENPMSDIKLEEEDRKDLEYLRRIFRLLQLFCEGHYQKMQNFLREQTFRGVRSGTSFDFILMSSQFFSSYIKFVNIFCVEFGNQLLDFMIEAIQGPSIENQVSFCKNKTIDVCKDFLAKFQRERDFIRVGFFTEYEQELVGNVVTKSSKLLFSLIEGPPNEDNLSMLTQGLDFNFILNHLKEEFKDFVERQKGSQTPIMELDLEDFNEELEDLFDDDFLEAFNLYSLIITLSDPSINKAGAQSVKDFLENVTDPELLKTLQFFKMHCRSIEIDFHQTIIRVYFPVHPICRFLSKNTRAKFGNSVNRETPNDKIKDLINSSEDFFDEMHHQAYLHKQILIVSSKRLNMMRDLSTVLAFLINFFILYSYSIIFASDKFNNGVVDASDPNINIDQTVNALGYTQLVASCLMLSFWMVIYAPLILKSKWREVIKTYRQSLSEDEKGKLDEYGRFDTPIAEAGTDITTSLLFYKGPDDAIFERKVKYTYKNGEEREIKWRDFGNLFTKLQYYWVSFRILFTTNELIYMFFYILISWMGVFISEIAYCLHLYDVINRFQTLTNVIRSVTYNAKQLILTLIFGLTLLYIYAIFGFYFFYDTYSFPNADGTARNECTTLIQCYIATINFGLRNGGGLGDVLSTMSYSQENATYYAIRYFYDLTFFAFINIVFLNIIFGIIVDTFAELREKKNKMDEDQKTVCFICGETRYTFDRFADGFENHIERDHQMWNYIFYLYLLKTKESTDYNGVESYISEMLAQDDNSWVPLLTAMSLSLNEEKKENIEEIISQQMLGLENQLDILKSKVDLLDKK